MNTRLYTAVGACCLLSLMCLGNSIVSSVAPVTLTVAKDSRVAVAAAVVPPRAPSNLIGVGASWTANLKQFYNAKLNFRDNATDETWFELQSRDKWNSNWRVIISKIPARSGTGYVDTKDPRTTKFYISDNVEYRVCAIKNGTASAYSNVYRFK